MQLSSSQCGWTVAHFAAYNGHLEMVQELLERFNCEADKRDQKVGVYVSHQNCYYTHTASQWHILTQSSSTDISAGIVLFHAAQVDPTVCCC